MPDDAYGPGARQLQDRFDTRRLADRLQTMFRSNWTLAVVQEFIERQPMFFLATVDAEGRPQCSYKGGAPGFVRVLGDRELCFPSYDGNGMYLSAGNVLEHPQVGMLFIDFAEPGRVRVGGRASIDADDPLLPPFPGAEMVVRVAVDEVFPNCPRYIHTGIGELSPNVPDAVGEAPIADWKREPWAQDVLAEGDAARGAPA